MSSDTPLRTSWQDASSLGGRAGLRSNGPSSVVCTPACPPTCEGGGVMGGRV
ncbi:hypothetical protein M404DRAFT_1006567 [Pisolithus tinctorius Marx 270]|uniref:Uncharacterized protein n=1 Tax=Pisolithus tinctorius Marx 270 TaxID=870435 RepID=A0A0C3NN86_PISTI|nr:hypothetical protein M404DRAFT_1006567 [Pisolithus tinctorius Marx 270]